MMAIYGPLRLILDIAFFIMIVHIIMSWLINFQVLNLHQPPGFTQYQPVGSGAFGGLCNHHFFT